MIFIRTIVFFICLLVLSACSTTKKTYVIESDKNGINLKLPKKDKEATLFLIGDTGTDKNYNDVQVYLFKQLKQALKDAGENSSIVFLGDNIYPAGLPVKENAKRGIAEHKLNTQLALLEDMPCKSYFIPGNHCWNMMRAGGLQAVQRQEAYIEQYYQKNKIEFFPNDGCGDPVVKKISDNITYVFIDTQWWLQNWKKENGINEGCNIKSRVEFLKALQAIFTKHKAEQIVVLMHHPLFSNGEHGGNFPITDHFFPFRIFNSKLWIPLPVIGSILPVTRMLGGIKQDIPHKLYQEFKDGILEMVAKNQQVIFASGHDHSLQYFVQYQHHFIISGAGSKVDFAKAGGDARMVRSAMGYSLLHFYEDETVWLDFYTVDKNKPKGELIYRKEIIK